MKNKNKEKIQHLYQELTHAERVIKDKEFLFCQRTEIENELNEASANLGQKELHTHRHLNTLHVEEGAPDPHEKNRQLLIKDLEEQRLSLTLIKKKLQNIDQLLDELEDDLDDKILSLHKELLASILEAYPEESATYEGWQKELVRLQDLTVGLESLHARLCKVSEYLEKSLGLWERSKWRGLWHFVFGKSPYTLISEQMVLVAKHAQQALTLLSDGKLAQGASRELKEQLPLLETHLSEVHRHSKGRWHYHRFMTTYPSDFEKMEAFSHMIYRHLQETKEAIRKGEEKIQEWLRHKGSSPLH